MRKVFQSFLVFLLAFSLLLTTANAAPSNALQAQYSQSLVKLGILQGYEDGSLRLQNNIKRSEFVTLIIRIMGFDKDTDIDNIKMPFKDMSKSHWAYNYMKIALKHKYITGYPDNTLAPDSYVTYAEALTVILRALGYESILTGKWPDNVLNKSSQLGLDKDMGLSQGKHLTRGEMSVIIYNSLMVGFNK